MSKGIEAFSAGPLVVFSLRVAGSDIAEICVAQDLFFYFIRM
jgi:hypothetical protein